MSSFEDIKTEFLQIYEGIAERRGMPGIVGKIMGVFFIENISLNQKQLSDLTGYSISSISRALEQMIGLGIIKKRKHESNEYYVYDMKTNFIDLAVMGLEKWIQHAEVNKTEIRNLSKKIDLENTESKNLEEMKNLKNTLNSFVNEIDEFIEILKKITKSN